MTTRDTQNLRSSDSEQLAYAVRTGRCFFTHNRIDFEALRADYLNRGQTHSGIVIGSRRQAYELAKRLGTLLDSLAADEFENQLICV